MYIAEQIIQRDKVEAYDTNLNYTYFEKQFDQIFPLDVYFSQMIQCTCN